MFFRLFLISGALSHCWGRLNIITVTAGRYPSISAMTIAPAYATALDDMTNLYPNLFANYSLTPINIDYKENPCTAEGEYLAIEDIVRSYGMGVTQSAGPTVILNSICARTFPIIGDLAREDSILTISCGPSEASASQLRYPTTTTLFPGTPLDYGFALVALMESFNWTSVAVVWDLCSGVPSGLAARVEGHMRGILPLLDQHASTIEHTVFYMDSTKEVIPFAYRNALWKAGNYSRIIVCGVLHVALRDLMAEAFDIGFVSQNYVFVYIYIFQIPGEHPPEWMENEKRDLKIRAMFERMLIIRSTPINWNATDRTMERIVRLGSEMFHMPYDPELKLNEFTIGCYESVEVLSQVLNSSRIDATSRIDPAAFIDTLKGKVFPLQYRDVAFGENGARLSRIVLQKFNTSSDDFQDVTVFNLKSRRFQKSLRNGEIWPSETVPLDRPPCGIHGERCPLVSDQSTIIIAVAVVCAVLLLLCIVACIRCHRRYPSALDRWWLLDWNLSVKHSVLPPPIGQQWYR